MKLVGANAKAVATGLQKQPGIVNYLIGNDPTKWRTRWAAGEGLCHPYA